MNMIKQSKMVEKQRSSRRKWRSLELYRGRLLR
uniref:Uncharacterized protein n=1 Tax=Elaeophora elaphi TaxID=1147741 RepID=A0A0R3RMF0_9BILA